MVIDSTRRHLIQAALLASVCPMANALGLPNNRQSKTASLIGCSVNKIGRYKAVVADEYGTPIHTIALPARGHGIAVSPSETNTIAAVFSRRPGTFILPIDYLTGESGPLIASAENRHFYGHGAFSNDGQTLFVTEGESTSSQGIIGVYDSSNGFKKVDEISGFGIGPHEIRVLKNDDIVVAVGGVHTAGRVPLNLDSMSPALCYFNQTGQMTDQVKLNDNQLSIRHLCTPSSDVVISGQQYRGSSDETLPLVAIHRRGEHYLHLNAEEEQWARFDRYIASIEVLDDLLLATSPRGNCYGVWSISSNELLEIGALPEASGVVRQSESLFVSSGSGKAINIDNDRTKTNHITSVLWDNHLMAI